MCVCVKAYQPSSQELTQVKSRRFFFLSYFRVWRSCTSFSVFIEENYFLREAPNFESAPLLNDAEGREYVRNQPIFGSVVFSGSRRSEGSCVGRHSLGRIHVSASYTDNNTRVVRPQNPLFPFDFFLSIFMNFFSSLRPWGFGRPNSLRLKIPC